MLPAAFPIFDCRLAIDSGGSCHTTFSSENRQSQIANHQSAIGPQKNLILRAMNTLKTTMA
jgi:hypothetical protein